jgi:hypothetical protein
MLKPELLELPLAPLIGLIKIKLGSFEFQGILKNAVKRIPEPEDS